MCWLCDTWNYDGEVESFQGTRLETSYPARLGKGGAILTVAFASPGNPPERVSFAGRDWHKPRNTECPAHWSYIPMEPVLTAGGWA